MERANYDVSRVKQPGRKSARICPFFGQNNRGERRERGRHFLLGKGNVSVGEGGFLEAAQFSRDEVGDVPARRFDTIFFLKLFLTHFGRKRKNIAFTKHPSFPQRHPGRLPHFPNEGFTPLSGPIDVIAGTPAWYEVVGWSGGYSNISLALASGDPNEVIGSSIVWSESSSSPAILPRRQLPPRLPGAFTGMVLTSIPEPAAFTVLP